MVAYSFKKRFYAPIRVGLGLPIEPIEGLAIAAGVEIKPKRQTIRAIGKRRHARVGEIVQLYYGMRTKQCMSIGIGRCTQACGIKIFIRAHELGKIEISGDDIVTREIRTRHGLDEFARADGFEDWDDMRQFWIEEHGDLKHLGPFVGALIQWEPIRG